MILIKREANEQLMSSYLAFVAAIVFVLIILTALIQFVVGDSNFPMRLYTDGVLRILLSIPCIIVLGQIIQGSGFKFAFATKGFKMGIFAHIFFLLWISLRLPLFFIATEFNMEFIPMIPGIIFFDLAVGIFEEVLFRGIFMTAMLIQFGGTAKGRIFCVLLNGLVFGLIHLIGGDFLTVLFTGALGVGFAAAYVYSKNLLSCMVVHALWNIAFKIPNGFIVDVNNAGLLAASQMVTYISIGAIFLFAIILTIKSKPFYEVAGSEITT